MVRTLVALGLFAAVSGCRTGGSEGGTKDADALPGAAVAACAALMDPADDHKVEMSVQNGRLTILQTSAIGDYTPLEYALSPIALLVAPSGPPKYACGEGNSLIWIWDLFARVDGQYYKLAAAAAPAAGASCSGMVDKTTRHTVDIRVDGDQMIIAQASTDALFKTMKYTISPVFLAVAPAGAANVDCTQAPARITVWGNIARVDGKYFKMTENAAGTDLAAKLQAVACVKFAEAEHTVGIPENPGSGGQATGNYIVLFKDGVSAESCATTIKAAIPGLKVLDSTAHMALVTQPAT